MDKFAKFVVKNKKLFILISLILIIPSIIGYFITKTNYDILVYLPSDIETLKGQNILTDEFKMGSFSISIVDGANDNELSKIENEIREIDCVTEVLSINDVTGIKIPLDMIPKSVLDKVAVGDSRLLLIIFSTGTSDDKTMLAIDKISEMSNSIKVGGMSSMVHDTRVLFESQTFLYVFIAVVCCLIILLLSLDSYIVPFSVTGDYKFRSKNLVYRIGKPFKVTNMELNEANKKLEKQIDNLMKKSMSENKK